MHSFKTRQKTLNIYVWKLSIMQVRGAEFSFPRGVRGPLSALAVYIKGIDPLELTSSLFAKILEKMKKYREGKNKKGRKKFVKISANFYPQNFFLEQTSRVQALATLPKDRDDIKVEIFTMKICRFVLMQFPYFVGTFTR